MIKKLFILSMLVVSLFACSSDKSPMQAQKVATQFSEWINGLAFDLAAAEISGLRSLLK
jgi:hypothetical protein